MANPGPGYAKHPGHLVRVEDHSGRHRIVVDGQIVADSRRTLLVTESGHGPVHYFPEEDVRRETLRSSDRQSHCPFKGDAVYWHLSVGGKTVENAVWAYPRPFDEVSGLAGHVAFDIELVDELRFGG